MRPLEGSSSRPDAEGTRERGTELLCVWPTNQLLGRCTSDWKRDVARAIDVLQSVRLDEAAASHDHVALDEPLNVAFEDRPGRSHSENRACDNLAEL